MPTIAVMTPFVTAQGGARDAEDAGRAPVADRLAHAFRDLVLALEEAEAALPARHALDVVRHRLDEVVDLVDQDRHEETGQRDDPEQGADVGDRHGQPAPGHAVGLEPLDRGVEREREEERDEDPDQHAAGDQDHLDDHERGDDDAQHDENRARAELHEALLHGARIGPAADGAQRALNV